MSFSIVIPAYNESKSIAIVLGKIIETIDDAEIIVVDDCSTDNTIEVLEQFERVKIVKHVNNMGPTAALMTGFHAATFDAMVSLDADGQHPIESIEKIVNPILNDEADLVLGTRSELPRLGEKIIALAAGVSDATTGFKAMRKKCVQFVEDDIAYGGMLIVKAKKRNLRVKEVPTKVIDRMEGHSTQSNYLILKRSLKFVVWTLFNKR
ncbi:glycosyltransferase family 2 protein [Aquibacillus saliphilus]|uniref:glycosyltransferase family 2 protein n=1 Tax=Aquibacillus saliphilus TaxID=1909422 RepID=UPI001CEFC595|nr:glycosyltransferase family 2 protein [Aquibacillus saliphilus]